MDNIYELFKNDRNFRYRMVYELVKRGYVIHGTDSEFNRFDINKVKGGLRGKYGYGAYFTDAAYKCEEYGNNFVFCNINDFNIIDLDNSVDKNSNPFVTSRITNDIVRMAVDYLQKNDNITYLQLNYYLSNHARGWEDASQDVSEMYLQLGYDGFKCGSEIVLFNFIKLNKNIVKDKISLLNDVYQQMKNTNESINKKAENIIRECIREALKEIIDEVRYIDTKYEKYNGKVQKNNWTDEYNQEPIKNGEKIRVFHGCELQTACQIAIEGTSGKTYHPRQYSYESGMNPLGIFVTTDFEVAKKFGASNTGMCIIEFTADTNDLEAPVWNGQGTYFGQGTNPMPFNNADERNSQKMQYRKDAQNLEDDDYYVDGKKHNLSMSHVRNSDKPELANSIFRNNEHQALFMGDLNPNMIKRIWVNLPGDNGYVHTSNAYRPMSVREFLKTFGNKEWIDYDYGRNRKYKIKKTRLFDPAENVNSFDDLIDRLYSKENNYFKTREEAAQCLKDQGMLQSPPSDYAYDTIKYELWPRQIIQLYGKDYFDKNFNKLKQ